MDTLHLQEIIKDRIDALEVTQHNLHKALDATLASLGYALAHAKTQEERIAKLETQLIINGLTKISPGP
jgi:hypothetical protein